ncbi:MAG: hypothetical protein B7Y39_11035 [Bdellovibrio sp. 28-41-41]|nr:MAG: hypothetical protein B7Y39_11035 [Bdellovibrio sp. 28-41-41]
MSEQNDSKERKPFKKRSYDEEESHPMVHDESNWLVSYADLMTLLFGFFVIMYSISKVDPQKYTIVAKDFAKYFGGKVESITVFDAHQKMVEGLLKSSLPEGTYQVAATPTGISIRFNSNLLFRPGSAKLQEEMYPVLTKLIDALQNHLDIEAIDFEGHTDDEPISSEYFPTNWELSSARATRILRQFESSGFKSETLTSMGYGSSRPEVPNRDEQGKAIKENQAKNRRVVVNLTINMKDKARINELLGKDFKLQESLKESVSEDKTNPEIDTEENLRDRMELAKDKIKALQERVKKNSAIEKKRKAVEDLEKKAHDLEQKTKETSTP